MNRRLGNANRESAGRRASRRRVATSVALVVIAAALPVLGPTVSAADKADNAPPLLAPPGDPPAPLADLARVPVLATLDENGVRDPDDVPILLAGGSSPSDTVRDLDALPEDGAASVDVFAVGPYNADHVAAVYTEDVNYEASDGEWKDLPELAADDAGWSATVAWRCHCIAGWQSRAEAGNRRGCVRRGRRQDDRRSEQAQDSSILDRNIRGIGVGAQDNNPRPRSLALGRRGAVSGALV